MKLPLMTMIVLLAAVLSACATGPEPVYKLYPGPVRAAEELTVLRFGDYVREVTIDGLHVDRSDYSVVELEPGLHQLGFSATFPVSVMVNSAMWDGAEALHEVDLQAGRTYEMSAARTTGHGYSMFLWLEDAATGQVVAGVRKP
jgi:hypothetical protein